MLKKITTVFFSTFWIAFTAAILPVFGQNPVNARYAIHTDSVVFAENESLVALTLELVNRTDSAFEGEIVLKSVPGVQLLGVDGVKVTLDAASKVYYPLRLSIGQDASAGETPLLFDLRARGQSNPVASFVGKLLVAAKRQVQLINHRPTELMEHVGDSLSVSVLLSNQGNSSEQVTVTASFPDLRGGSVFERKQVMLRAFQDSIVVFRRVITKELLQMARYTVNVAGLYDDGRLINNVLVGVQNVSGNRVYADPAWKGYRFDSYSNNRISVSGRNLFNPNEALQVNGRGVFQTGAGQFGFGLDGYFYTQFDSRPLFTNTYLNYEQNNKGVTVGNLSENMEMFINGRGVKLYAGDEAQNRLVEVGVVDKSFNLLGDEFQLPGGNGYTAFARTQLNRPERDAYLGSVLYDRSPINNSENLLLMNNYQFPLNANLRLGFDLGGGLTRQLEGIGTVKPSLAIGNQLNGTLGRYTISSVNFYSSGYYPGIRRGVIQLNERISRNFNNLNAWVSYNYYEYDPKYFLTQLYVANSSNSRIEAGAYFPFSSNFNLSVSAKKHTENGRISYLATAPKSMLTLEAYRLNETIGWRSSNDRHRIYFSSENGVSKDMTSGKGKLQLRTNATWNYRGFTLNGFFQLGDFTVLEAYSNAQRGDKNVYRFNIAPSFRKSFLRNALDIQLDLNYHRDSYAGNSVMYAANANYAFSRLFSGFISANLYDYHSDSYQTTYSLLQTGVTYNLPSGSGERSGKKGNIAIFLFFDQNSNGVFDEGDVPAGDRVVTIGDVSFISLSDGTIQYRKVPYGNYSLTVPSNDWFAAAAPGFVLQSSELQLSIPLQQTGRFSGSFRYVYNEQTSLAFNATYAGLRVFLTSADGDRYDGFSNASGEFVLFVPEGKYTFSIDENSLPENVYTTFVPKLVHISHTATVALPPIELNVKQRAVEVKRFSAE